MDAKERIAIVRTKLISRVPFMGHLCLKLEPIEDPSIPTMGVTRDRKLYYNPTFVSGLSDAELAGVLCHETLHGALLCFERQGTRLMAVNGGISLWNVAHDYAINQIIVDFKHRFLKLPAGGLQDDKYRNLSAEEIYDLLREGSENLMVQNRGPGGKGGEGGEGDETGEESGDGESEEAGESGESGEGNSPGQSGNGKQIDLPDNAWGHDDMKKSGKALSEAEKRAEDTKWKVSLAEAQQIHQNKQQGSLPGQLEKIIEEMLEPKLPWSEILARWVGENGLRADFTWSRPNRRSESVGEFLPSLKKHGADDLIVLWDTSGSMNGREAQILGEVIGICDDLNMSLRVMCCDTRVCSDVEDVRDAEDVDVKGGGGSDFTPAFDQLTDEGYQGVVVSFTDGWIGVPEVKPVHLRDCLWVIGPGDVDPTRGQWGEVLKVDAEGYAVNCFHRSSS